MQIPPKRVLLSVRSLCKDFQRPNGVTHTALDNVNLDIYDLEFVTILGLSGSGKTSLLRCMSGLSKPDRGYVTLAPTPIENDTASALVFQAPALFPWLTLWDNIALAVHNLPAEEKEARVNQSLEMLGLKGFEDCFPRDLSLSMKQRANICRALVSEPMILFMDEPFSQQDKLSVAALRTEIERLWLQGDRKIRSIVIASNDVAEAMRLSDRIVILSDNPGRIHKIIDIPLGHPRDENSVSYLELEKLVERIFGKLHLDKITSDRDYPGLHLDPSTMAGQPLASANAAVPAAPAALRPRPLINTGLFLVEGLVTLLSEKFSEMDLYDLCEEMGQSVEQMLPAVAAAELLGFVYTPGTKIVLTEQGKQFAIEEDAKIRKQMFRDNCLKLKLVSELYESIASAGQVGLEREVALERIHQMLPFEDADAQFQAFLNWARHADLVAFDESNDRLYAGDLA